MTSSPSASTVATDSAPRTDWVAVARQLGPAFAARAAVHDATDAFVAENYRDLKQHHVFSAGVPAQLGGGGVTSVSIDSKIGAGGCPLRLTNQNGNIEILKGAPKPR